MNTLCAGCGACCRDNVPVLDTDAVPEALTRTHPDGRRWMRNDGIWCAALDQKARTCSIYAQRPQVCREFVVAGPQCDHARSLVNR